MVVPSEQGVLLLEITSGSPATRAGLRGGQNQVRLGRTLLLVGGDILTAIDGQPVATARDLLRYVDTQTTIGQTIQLTLWRDGQEVTVPVTLSEEPR